VCIGHSMLLGHRRVIWPYGDAKFNRLIDQSKQAELLDVKSHVTQRVSRMFSSHKLVKPGLIKVNDACYELSNSAFIRGWFADILPVVKGSGFPLRPPATMDSMANRQSSLEPRWYGDAPGLRGGQWLCGISLASGAR
jgi:hypothetical protein